MGKVIADEHICEDEKNEAQNDKDKEHKGLFWKWVLGCIVDKKGDGGKVEAKKEEEEEK